jgi:hypothetical protein
MSPEGAQVATSLSCGIPAWVDGPSMDAQTPFRTFDVGTRVLNTGTASANITPSGVFPSLGAMAVTAASGMNVTVSAGYCCVANSSSSLQGGYIFGLMTSQQFTIAAADTTNPRLDLVVAYAADNGDSTSSSYVAVLTGTPAAIPALPSVPANSLTLAQVAVAANVTSIVPANITDERTYVCAPGGILPIQNAASAPAVPASQFMYNLATGQLVQGTGASGTTATPSVLQWVPQMSVITSSVRAASAGALTTVTSVSVTTDGTTDIEIYAKWPGVIGSASFVQIFAYLDSTIVDTAEVVSSAGANPTGGGSMRFFTSSTQSNTPSAGTHTITLRFEAGGSGTSTSDGIFGAAGTLIILRVAPVIG